MKDYLLKKITILFTILYTVTAFTIPVNTAYAFDSVSSGNVPAVSENEGSESGENDEDGEGDDEKEDEDEKESDDEGLTGDGYEVISGDEIDGAVSEDTVITVVSEDESRGIPMPDLGLSDEEAAGAGGGEPPYVKRVLVSLYSLEDPEKVIALYDYASFATYRYSPDEDAAVPMSGKTIADLHEVEETVSCTSMVFFTNNGNVEFELEQVDPKTGDVLSNTGRLKQASFTFTRYALYRLRVFALYDLSDANNDEAIYYFYTGGIDKEPPKINKAEFSVEGAAQKDKNGKNRYGQGKVTITATDDHTGLASAAYMLDYPNGEWVESNVISQPKAGIFTLAVRDRANNIATTTVDTSAIDTDPPVLTDYRVDYDRMVNGYCISENIHIEADDETGLPPRFISVGGKAWDSVKDIHITENGSYGFRLRDVFGNISENMLEISNIDKDAPLVSYTVTPDKNVNGYCTKDVLKINAADKGVGIRGKAYSFDGGKTWVSDTKTEVTENGKFEICAKDELGNMSQPAAVEIKNIDRQQPVITGVNERRKNTAGIYAGYSEVTVNARDDMSGLDKNHISFDDGKTWTSENKKTFRENGTCKLKVRDGVGNTAEASLVIENLDTKGPECTVSGNPETAVKSKAVLKVAAEDDLSGLKSVYVENARAGIKKLIGEYKPDDKGLGKSNDNISVEVTANGEYVFTLTDMCENVTTHKGTVSKLVKPSTDPKTEEPDEKEDEKNVIQEQMKATAQELSAIAEEKVQVTFTPHLLPINRGIISTIYCNPKENSNRLTLEVLQ